MNYFWKYAFGNLIGLKTLKASKFLLHFYVVAFVMQLGLFRLCLSFAWGRFWAEGKVMIKRPQNRNVRRRTNSKTEKFSMGLWNAT